MSDYPAVLRIHLGDAYRQTVVGRWPIGPSARRLKEAFEADAGLRREAEAKLASIPAGGSLYQRDYVSRAIRDILAKALEN